MTFEELGLNKKCADRLLTHGIRTPTFIQTEVFSLLRKGDSVVALSKTGTGKTMAYLAPLVQRYTYDLSSEDLSSKTWGLVLVPTRELADQVSKNLKLLTGDELQSVVIVGGESEKNQISQGKIAALYVATPGRFLDLLKRKLVEIDQLKSVVFDEADRILDMGFIDDIRAIRRLLPKDLQMCFFSATLHFGVDEMSYEFGVEAQRIGSEADDVTVEGLDHRVSFVGDQEKFHALANFLAQRPRERGIVFTNYRDRAHDIVSRLKGLGVWAESLTAQLSQIQRTRSMQLFREGKTQVLVASDLASRGLDVESLDFVVNYDLPEDSATYVHRVGRTARAGQKGMALSLVGFNDTFRLEKLEKFLGKSIVRFNFESEHLQGPLPKFFLADGSPAPRIQSNENEYRSKHFENDKSHSRHRKDKRPARHPNMVAKAKETPLKPRTQKRPSPLLSKPESPSLSQIATPKLSLATKILDKLLGLFGVKRKKALSPKRSSSKPKHFSRSTQKKIRNKPY